MTYSVIVPIYNAEKTLHRCVDSLLNQNYEDAEIILVNDGSKDRSGEICQEYASKSDRIVYIDKPNGGVSSARNAGLDAAKGDYILFVDSDDFVADHYFQTLDVLCEEIDYDCLFFSHNIVDESSCQHKALSPFVTQIIDESVSKFCEAYYLKFLNPPWNKRYKRSIIDTYHLRFPESLSIGEDKIFCLNYVLQCSSCLITSELLYNVSIDNKDSLSRKPRADLPQQFEIMDDLVQKTILNADISDSHRQQYLAAENLIQLRSVYSDAKRMHLSRIDKKQRIQAIKHKCSILKKQTTTLPSGAFSILLQVPVKLKLVHVIDWMGKYLAK